MGARQITLNQRLVKVVPVIVLTNLVLLSGLVFLTSQNNSNFLPQAGDLIPYAIAFGKFSSYLLGLIALGLILKMAY